MLLAMVVVWIALIAVGVAAYHAYATTPGAVVGVPAHWPDGSRLPRPARAVVVMFVDPACPCSRASLRNLTAVLREHPAAAVIVFTAPAADGDAAWDLAGAIPNALRRHDPTEAARFGATTSGFAVLYDDTGRRRFAGGLTSERGHAGESVGTVALAAALAAQAPIVEDNPVYGCALEGL
jgi:hypothetical protein